MTAKPEASAAPEKKPDASGMPRRRENLPLRDALLLAFISMMGPFAANTYIPAFPAMTAQFGVTEDVIAQSLSIYLVCFAVMSLFVGTLSDTLGRKIVVVGGAFGFCAAAVGAALSDTFGALLFWRVLQGCCASVGPVLTQAIVRDRWSGTAATRMLALMTLLFALAPAFAPIVGGYVTVHFGWRAVFVFLAILNGLIGLLSLLFLKESLPVAMRRPLALHEATSGYRMLLSHRAYLFGVVGHGLCFMGGILYSAGGADFVMRIMKMGVEDFGYLTIPMILFSMAGSFLTGRLVARIGWQRTLVSGLVILVGSGAAGVAATTFLPHDALVWPWVIAAPCVYQFAMSWSRPVMVSLNLDYFPKHRGMAASVQQFFHTLSFALCAALWVPLVMGDASKYAWVTLGAGVATALCWVVVFRARRTIGMPSA